jgi:diaminopimelate decarboxylase
MEQWSKLLDLNHISETYSTPLYVINVQQIKRNFSDYQNLVNSPKNIVFPVKSNPSLAVLRYIESLGGSVDCASLTEVRLANAAGFSPASVVYNSPAADMKLILDLLKIGSTVVLDSEDMVRQIDKILSKNDVKGKILLRINPQISFKYDSETEWEDMVAHGDTTSRFGILSENIIPLLNEMQHLISGLHIHVGTQMDNLKSFERMLAFLHDLVDDIHNQTKHKIEILDLGGGLGIPFTENDTFPSINELSEYLLPIKKAEIEYWVEPGHSLVGDAIGLLTKVSAIKKMRGKTWGIVDVGTDQLSKVTLLRWPHRILDANHQPLPLEGSDSLGGPLCFSGDTLLPSTQLDKVKQGDNLFIQHCGAYCYALSSSFNGRPSPAHLLIEDDKILGLAKKKEDFFVSPNILDYYWSSQAPTTENFLFEIDDVNALSSKYLRDTNPEDAYQYLSCMRIGKGSYQFEIETRGKVGFVSMPFIIRMAGDAAIIAVCDLMGKKQKNIDIWGSQLMLKCDEIIPSNSVITCQIDLSGLSTRSCGKKCSILAQFSLNQGKSQGTFQLAFENN